MKSKEEQIAFACSALGLPPDAEIEIIPFEGRGSDRAYFRVRWSSSQSAILVQYDPARIENAYYAAIAFFLGENHIPVPEIIRNDPDDCSIIMKDLGDLDLWALRNDAWETRRSMYQKTLRIVHRLHSIHEAEFPSTQVKLTDAFGPNLYRWERDYFRDNFVKAFCSLELDSGVAGRLEHELASLATRLSLGRRSLVHRDLQSQNVMIYRDEPFLIDFQGMRFGTRFYDLGSILCDPYVSFSEAERCELLRFYYDLSEPETGWDEFQNRFWEASAQRLMQALGAYGFLGITKGLRNYLAHVPSGIRNLRSAAQNSASLPTLLEVCIKCEAALANSRFEIRDSRFV